MKWIALYSGTGREIRELSNLIGREPDKKLSGDVDFSQFKGDELITLHGYMKIVPKEYCDKLTIYNGHPGLITRYPELKGKDPQIRAAVYDTIGSVVHKVIAEVDSGEVVTVAETINDNTDIFEQLRATSLKAWVEFFKSQDTTVNNGGPTHYYDLDPSWKGAGDIIEGRGMNFNQGTIFKAAFCFNIGRHEATDYERELNKIIYFAKRELEWLKTSEKKKD